MNKRISIFMLSALLALVSIQCSENEIENGNSEAPKSHIEQLEKESGLTFYKRDLQLFDETNQNSVVMRVAALKPELVDSYIREYIFSISPTFNAKEQRGILRKDSEEIDAGSQTQEDVSYEGVFTEFVKVSLQKEATGFRTNAVLRNRQFANGRSKIASDFPSSATHYNNSGNWPERFKMFAYQTVGWKFHGKTKWYSGWSTRTFCNWYDNTDCTDYWEQASETWVDIDGPWDVKATVYYFNYTDYSFEWNNW